MADIFAKLAGTVYYTDGSTGVFAASYENGVLNDPFSATSLENFKHLYSDKATEIDSIFSAIDGTYTTTITPAAQVPDKTVSNFVVQFNGRIQRADGTWADFGVQYTTANGLNILAGADGVAFQDVADNATFKAAVDSMLEACTGSGNVSIA